MSADDPPVMTLEARPQPLAGSRSSDVIVRGSPKVLLPSGGSTAPGDPTATPQRSLAADALALLLALRSRRRPRRWSAPAFAAEVELVRSHLAPIDARDGLVSSFTREAFHAFTSRTNGTASMGPTRVAYAIRWLELGDRKPRPAWLRWLEQPADDVEGARAG